MGRSSRGGNAAGSGRVAKHTALIAVALCFILGLWLGSCGGDDDICSGDEDCPADHHCVSFDPDPTDNIIYTKRCARACTPVFQEECQTNCCALVDGTQVCSPESFCE